MKKNNFSRILLNSFLAGIISAFINVILFLLFKNINIITNAVILPSGEPIGALPIIFSSILPSIIGGLIYWLLALNFQNGYRIFLMLSIILLAVSFVNPFVFINNAPLTYAIALNIMHIVVAVVLLITLRR